MGHATNGDGVSAVLIALTYLCLLGAGILVVLRHAPSDKGGVIDAAVIGIAGAGPLWEFLLRPRLQEQGVPSGQQLIMLVEIFALLAFVGALGRISATTGRARFSLQALYVSQATALVGFVASVVTSDKATNGRAGWITLVWIVCYLSLGAALLHPHSADLPVPERYRESTLSFKKLAALGAVLTVLPLAGSAPQLTGRPADGLLIAVGTLVAVPLVLLRIGQLIAQRAADQRALAQLAAHDDLTGLPNRRTMITLLEQALDDPTADPVTVLYCDLDGFKPVNDTFGHRAGDEVLCVVAQRLQHSVRAGDTVGRLGGDEFLVICPGLASDQASALQQRIEQSIAEPIAWQGNQITAGVTVGRASGAPGLAADTLIAEADLRMYVGKRTRARATA
jgi:diguanylate cyclase (GGDEF)-like protein